MDFLAMKESERNASNSYLDESRTYTPDIEEVEEAILKYNKKSKTYVIGSKKLSFNGRVLRSS